VVINPKTLNIFIIKEKAKQHNLKKKSYNRCIIEKLIGDRQLSN